VQTLLDSWAAAKKRAAPLRKAIHPLMEIEALRIAEDVKAFESNSNPDHLTSNH
jgi:hypothetical protein